MIRLIAVLLFLPVTADEPQLKPSAPKYRKRRNKWEMSLAVQTRLSNGAILQVTVQPQGVRYNPMKRMLGWYKPASQAITRRALVKNGWARTRISLPAHRRVRVTYEVSENTQVTPVVRSFPSGTSAQRLRAVQKEQKSPFPLMRKLDDLLALLEHANAAKFPHKKVLNLVAGLISVREECRRRVSQGALTGTIGYMERLTGDAITYASWIVNGRRRKATGGENTKGDTIGLDEVKSEEKSPKSGTGGGIKNKGAGNIRSESFGRLRRALKIVPILKREETVLLLLFETTILVKTTLAGTSPEGKALVTLGKLIEIVGRSGAGSETLAALRKAYTALQHARLDGAGESKPLREILRAFGERDHLSSKGRIVRPTD